MLAGDALEDSLDTLKYRHQPSLLRSGNRLRLLGRSVQHLAMLRVT